MSGYAALIGAGPGDPELITVKALRWLERADVVLFDALANPALLAHCRADAHLVDVGKVPRGPQTPQEVTNRLLVDEALAGNVVVRLKGGDPFVFGRGGEEALALAAAGVPFEVVPGVTSAVAAPASANIPVTHRGVSSQVTFVTGSAARSDDELHERWQHLAAAGGTLVFLMPVRMLSEIRHALFEGGLSPRTPAAIVERGTCADERVLSGTLADIVERARCEGVGSPAVLVVGDVVEVRAQIQRFVSQHDGDPGAVEENHVQLQ
jgi:uroporphyrin-III C-methyltransferase